MGNGATSFGKECAALGGERKAPPKSRPRPCRSRNFEMNVDKSGHSRAFLGEAVRGRIVSRHPERENEKR